MGSLLYLAILSGSYIMYAVGVSTRAVRVHVVYSTTYHITLLSVLHLVEENSICMYTQIRIGGVTKILSVLPLAVWC